MGKSDGIDLSIILDPRGRLLVREVIEETVRASDTLALDSESDREVLIARLKRALGLSA